MKSTKPSQDIVGRFALQTGYTPYEVAKDSAEAELTRRGFTFDTRRGVWRDAEGTGWILSFVTAGSDDHEFARQAGIEVAEQLVSRVMLRQHGKSALTWQPLFQG